MKPDPTKENPMLAVSSELFWNHDSLKEMFTVGLPIIEKMLRPICVYVFLVISLRIFGKRELTNINPFDFVVLLTLSNTVQNAIIGNDNSVSGGIIGALTLLATNYLVVRFIFKHRRLDQLVEGSPTTLVENGKVDQRALAKELLTEAELLTVAHRQGFGSIEEIESCVLEPGGNFYVKGKTPGGDETRHTEILNRLDQLTKQIAALNGERDPRTQTP
jgi:uncharacterized membrane protein YcaP (DUF421 family)